ncbi:MAG: xanthine dehydrogenase family protein molybdopterin-binding subunit [Alphaproteobacteria bacterium]|nr:xanthine dehydrogenase family protein molybdopterin-binding subunit [Alphaproteobacteria bacterium]
MTAMIGQALNRVDGRLKVTGGARYAAETALPNLAYAVLVQSTIGKGRIAEIDAAAAERAPGVLAVLTHENAPKPAAGKGSAKQPGEAYPLLQDDRVHYNGQHIAVVIAETFETATHAAGLLRVRYDEEGPVARLDDALDRVAVPEHFRDGARPPDSQRGDPDAAFAAAAVTIDETYTTPVEHHNPMEPHAVVAAWDGEGALTLFHSTQAVAGSRDTVAELLGLAPDKIRVVSHFVGGGFGCKGSTWPHVTLAAMAARAVQRPVKLVLTRRQMFTSTGLRSKTVQRLRLGADREGRLVAMRHDGVLQTATFGEWVEPVGLPTETMYSCPNVAVTHRVAPVNFAIPTFMRAPGESSGMYALESAMDELAYALALDPLELRLRNYAVRDEHQDLPWSSKSLAECYARGAAAFGWPRRDPAPRSMREGDSLIGWGMASATYPANRSGAAATVRLEADGTVVVESGTQDIGTGTYTIMAQVAADALGVPVARVRVRLGDSRMPNAPGSGGSQTAASVAPAVDAAARAVRQELIAAAQGIADGPLAGGGPEEVEIADGMLFRKNDPRRRISIADALRGAGRERIEAMREANPGDEKKRYGMHAFGAHFVEVRIDPELGAVRVSRYVGAFAAGRVLNAKTARSQMIGGIVYGFGMALFEETAIDRRSGRVVNANIAEYLVPVNADVPQIEVILIDEADPHVNPLGIKGMGELPMVGAAAAIANAVYHATGKRVRDLPIRPEKLMA